MNWVDSINEFMVPNDNYDEYCYDLTKVNGSFSIVDDSLHVEAGNGLAIAYTLADGTAVNGNLTVKNSKTTIVDTDWEIDGEGNKTIVEKSSYIIPASIEGVLNAGGKKTAGLKITTDVNLAGDMPTLTDTYSATCEVSADKYVFAVTRAKYSQTEVGLAASIKYDNQTVVAATFEAKGKIATSEDGEEINPLASTGNVNATFSIMDNVQLKGTLNWTELAKFAESRIETEDAAKEIAAKAEKYINLTLYIQNTAQAKLGFEPIKEGEGDAAEWDVLPVVRFEDGSAYVMPEEFFSPNSFPKTVEAVSNAMAEMQAFLEGPAKEDDKPLK